MSRYGTAGAALRPRQGSQQLAGGRAKRDPRFASRKFIFDPGGVAALFCGGATSFLRESWGMNSHNTLQFDFDAWKTRLALSPVEVRERLGWGICGPSELIAIEMVRADVLRVADLGPSLPCDIHVFVSGESPMRDATKVGGLPYRPRSIPWPQGPDGTPMVFLCQFAFHDSSDLFGARSLPGDVLLVFAPEAYPSLDDHGRCFEIEWYPRGLGDLLDSTCIPAVQQTFQHVYYALRHRTVDYGVAEPAESLIQHSLGPSAYGWGTSGLPVRLWNATKIGGIPYLTGIEDWRPPADASFLCAFAPIIRDSTIADRRAFRLNDRGENLCWYDGFTLNVFYAGRRFGLLGLRHFHKARLARPNLPHRRVCRGRETLPRQAAFTEPNTFQADFRAALG